MGDGLDGLRDDVGPGDLVVLKLKDSRSDPAGYFWNAKTAEPLIMYPGAGDGELGDIRAPGGVMEVVRMGIDVSNGTYLGIGIEGYKVVSRRGDGVEEREGELKRTMSSGGAMIGYTKDVMTGGDYFVLTGEGVSLAQANFPEFFDTRLDSMTSVRIPESLMKLMLSDPNFFRDSRKVKS